MIPLPEVQRHVLERVERLEPHRLPLHQALGLALAEDVVATEPVPPFANSAMDGYAVRAADTAGASETSAVLLTVVDELPAGKPPTVPVGPGQAIRIMTGAPFPDGADAVVMVEFTAKDGERGVSITRAAQPGQHVRGVGGDVALGTVVFPSGTVLTGAHVGVIASLGQGTVVVHPRARVGVLSTGDELAAVDSGPLAPGTIRDSNRPMLLALLERAGCEPVDLGWSRDDEDAITEVVQRGLATCDAVVSSGGVSVGDFDYMKVVLDRVGHMSWFQVAIKPSKPFAFGTATVGGRTVPIFGLPGNPVSSNVSFELFARPALLAMMGHPRPFRPLVEATADEAMARRPDGKLHLDRVRVTWRDGAWHAERSGAQVSNVLSAMAHANALALLPDGSGVGPGGTVTLMLLDGPDGEADVLTSGSPAPDTAAAHEDCD